MSDSPLTPSPLVTPSSFSTPTDTTEGVLTLPTFALSLAQFTRLKVGERFRDAASPYDEDDSFAWPEELVLVEQYLEEIVLEELCDDMVVGAVPNPSLGIPFLLKSLTFSSSHLPYALPPSFACI